MTSHLTSSVDWAICVEMPTKDRLADIVPLGPTSGFTRPVRWLAGQRRDREGLRQLRQGAGDAHC